MRFCGIDVAEIFNACGVCLRVVDAVLETDVLAKLLVELAD